jgi:cytochrome b pre-mRNA-processing protein 3
MCYLRAKPVARPAASEIVVMLNVLRRVRERRQLAREHYRALSSRSRAPEFFTEFAVPDTIDGRFDLLTLHAWLVLARLKEQGAHDLAQSLTNAIFIGFDEGLRDLGAGDMGIGKKVKKMADAFYGRLNAYGAAKDEADMADTLLRNVYRGGPEHGDQARRLAHYVLQTQQKMAGLDLKAGRADFGSVP